MRNEIAKNIMKTRILPSSGGSDDEHNHTANHCAYVVRSGDRATGKDRQFLINHPQVFLIDDSQYRIIEASTIRYEVFVENNIRARFFHEDKACEYVLLLNKLI